MEEKIYTIQEIANILGVSRNNIYYYIKKNNEEYLSNKYIVYKTNVNNVKQVYITELGYNAYRKEKSFKMQNKENNTISKEEVEPKADYYKDKYIEFLENEIKELKKDKDSLIEQMRTREDKHSEEVRTMLLTFNNAIKALPSAEQQAPKAEKKESFINRIFGGTSR